MSESLSRAAEILVQSVPPGPTAGQLRSRLRARRGRRLAGTAALTLVVVVNGLLYIGSREPTPVRPGAPTHDTETSLPASTTAPPPTTTPPGAQRAPSSTSANRAPNAVNDVLMVATAGQATAQVLANDTDPDLDRLRLVSVGAPTPVAAGTVTIVADDTLTFTPAADFVGEATITYTIADDSGLTDTATVTVVVATLPTSSTVDATPVATDDRLSTPMDQAVTVPVLNNDVDPDGDGLRLVSVVGVTAGMARVNTDDTITYTPPPGYVGQVTFTYAIRDSSGATAAATVTVTVATAAPTVMP